MRSPNSLLISLLTPMLLLACGDKEVDEGVDTSEPAPIGQDADDDGYLLSEDCNDTNAEINPGAVEVCDGIDNNCDSQIDEDVKTTYYQDADSDGYGNESEVAKGCSPPDGYIEAGGDCNDSTADGVDYNPGITEVCDGVDNNCDEAIDEGVVVTFYSDADGDGYGVDGKTADACDPPSGYSAENTDCDDEDGTIFPGAPEVCGDDEVNDCDGLESDAADYCDRLSGALSLNSTATQYWIGRHNDDGTGYSVALVGDMTGDGRSEILIGAPYEDIQADDAGAFYIVDGASTDQDLDDAAIAIILGDLEGDGLGLSVSATGDINNDGHPDFMVGSPAADINTTDDGAAFVFYGPLTGSATVSSVVDVTISGAHGGSATAYSFDEAGDVNGDGHPDLLIGAYGNYDRNDYPGAVHLVYGPVEDDMVLEIGSEAGSSGVGADLMMIGITPDSWLGYAVAGIGDINGDGFDDMALGAPVESTLKDFEGATYIIYGGEDIVSDDFLVSDFTELTWLVHGEELVDEVVVSDVYDGLFTGEFYGDYSGWAIEFAGDIDDDGTVDVLIGAPNNSDTAKNSGSAYLFYGPHSGTRYGYAADVRFRGAGSGDLAGNGIATGEDVTGDGVDDLLIGAPFGNGAGSVYLFSGDGATGGY